MARRLAVAAAPASALRATVLALLMWMICGGIDSDRGRFVAEAAEYAGAREVWNLAAKLEAKGLPHSAAALRRAEEDCNVVKRNRYLGFRFEISKWITIDNLNDAVPSNLDENDQGMQSWRLRRAQAAIKRKADELFCFGWTQFIGEPHPRVVGEARCGVRAGDDLLYWLEGHAGSDLYAHVYDDTKISLHFPDFEILEPSRETCFSEPPHACEDPSLFTQRLVSPDIIWLTTRNSGQCYVDEDAE